MAEVKEKAKKETSDKKTDNTKPKTTTKPAVKSKTAVLEEDFNLDAKVSVRNLAGWDVTFTRRHDGYGDIIIPPNGIQRLSRNEVQAQINDGNRLFIGTDGMGSHATIYIEDAETRIWVGFEYEDKPQVVITDELVTKLFKLSQSDFEEQVEYYIVTRAEKYAFIETIKKLNFNDYRKMTFAQQYTGYKF